MASQYSDPYEEWKQNGRQGGTYKPPTETPAAPAAPTTPDVSKSQELTNQLTQGAPKPQSGYQNYQNYQPPQQGYQTYQNPTGQATPPQNNPAQNYFNSFSAADQANIKKSWGGNDLMNEWYSNAQKSGATNAAGAQAPNTGVSADQKTGLQTIQVDPTRDLRSQGIASREGEVGWSQPNMPDRTGMRAWAKANGMSEDFDRFDENQMLRWQSKIDPSCPPKTPFRSDHDGGCVEKPIDVSPGNPSGYGSGGGAARGGQGGAGGYGAGGVGGQGGVGTGGGEGGNLALYQVKDQYAQALADPTGQKAWELYAGQGGHKTFQAEMDRYRQQIMGMPQGPARQAAEQKMREVESSMRLDMPQQARTQALAGLSGIIQPELGYVGSERDRALQKLLGVGGLENQRYGQNLNYNLGSRGLDLQGQNQMWNQNTYFPWQAGNAASQLANDRYTSTYGIDKQIEQQNAQQAGATTGQILQQGAQYMMSDIRMKENIVPGRRGLSDLLKLRSYSYNYKDKPERTQSIMAQDVEKVAPELVKEFDGIKMVDSYGLLGMTMKAVQDLAKKMEKK